MLFRSSKPGDHRLHLLYLIQELPTRGIYKEALSAALEERRLLLGPGKLPLRTERAAPSAPSARISPALRFPCSWG